MTTVENTAKDANGAPGTDEQSSGTGMAVELALPSMETVREKLERYLSTNRKWLRDFLGELLGTTLLVAIICGNDAQAVLSKRTAAGNAFTTGFVNGMAISFGVYLSGNTSGGHINPAVTMVMVLVGRTKWRMLPVYWLAQYLGGIIGAGVVYGVYYDAIRHFDGGTRYVFGPKSTAGIFATYPQEFLSTGFGWFDQVIGTAVLTMCVFAVHDERNVEVPKYLSPLIVGLVVMVIGMAFGYNCSFPINPARDLGPRIFTAMAGWGKNVFAYRYYNWFWVPLMGPHVGAVLGTIIYMLFVGLHWETTFVKNVHLSKKTSTISSLRPSSAVVRQISSNSLGGHILPEIRIQKESVGKIAPTLQQHVQRKQSQQHLQQVLVQKKPAEVQKEQTQPAQQKIRYREFQFDKEIKILLPMCVDEYDSKPTASDKEDDQPQMTRF